MRMLAHLPERERESTGDKYFQSAVNIPENRAVAWTTFTFVCTIVKMRLISSLSLVKRRPLLLSAVYVTHVCKMLLGESSRGETWQNELRGRSRLTL